MLKKKFLLTMLLVELYPFKILLLKSSPPVPHGVNLFGGKIVTEIMMLNEVIQLDPNPI